MDHYIPVSTIADGMGLNITVHSYLDRLDFGLIADRELVPDLWDMVDMHIDEIGRLFEATGATWVEPQAGPSMRRGGGGVKPVARRTPTKAAAKKTAAKKAPAKKTAAKKAAGEEVGGEEDRGQEGPGEEVGGQESPGQEVRGEEVLGQEGPGEEVGGEEVGGEEVAGEEDRGQEVRGDAGPGRVSRASGISSTHALRELPHSTRYPTTSRPSSAGSVRTARLAAMDFDLPPDDHPDRLAVRDWLAGNPEPTGRELAEAGYVVPHWPAPWGLDADPIQQLIIDDELGKAGVRRPSNPIGIGWAAPTIFLAGTPDQHERFLPKIFSGEEVWCQLFSEPDAGSDLATSVVPCRPRR